MARPIKEGLCYFPLDTDFFDNVDDKLFDITNEFGPLGEVIYLRILCLIYKNGYYYEFSSMDKLCAILIKSIGNRWTRGKSSVAQVISRLAECNLLSSELMTNGILTSVGVQKRYLKVSERRRINTEKYWLLTDSKKEESGEALESAPKTQIIATETPIIATETPVIVGNNDTKEKKSKENKNNSLLSLFYSRAKERNEDIKEYGKWHNVYLTPQEYEDLENVIPQFVDYIDYFSSKLMDRGYSYSNHYETIISWWNTDRYTVGEQFGVDKIWQQVFDDFIQLRNRDENE